MRKALIAALVLAAVAISLLFFRLYVPEKSEPTIVANESALPAERREGSEADAHDPEPGGVQAASLSSPRPSAGNGSSHDSQALSPVEARLLTHGMVNDAALETLASTDFDDFIISLQAANTSDSGERSAAYRIEIEESLQRHPGLGAVDRFACGRTFCAGSLQIGTDRAALKAWAEGLQEQATLPIPTFSHRLLPKPDGSLEARFLLTTRGTGGFYSSGKAR